MIVDELKAAVEDVEGNVFHNRELVRILLREREVYRSALENLVHDKWSRTGTDSGQICKNIEHGNGSYTVGEYVEKALKQGDVIINELENKG